MADQCYFQMMMMQENTMLMKLSLQHILDKGLGFEGYASAMGQLRQSCQNADFMNRRIVVPVSLADAWADVCGIHSTVFGALLEMTSGYRLEPADAMARITLLRRQIEQAMGTAEAAMEKETGIKEAAQAEKRKNFLSDRTTKWFIENWGVNP